MSSSFDQTSGNESGMKRSLDERDGACATKISDGALDKIFVMRVVEETRKRATPPGPAWNAIHPFSFHRHMGTLYKAYPMGSIEKVTSTLRCTRPCFEFAMKACWWTEGR